MANNATPKSNEAAKPRETLKSLRVDLDGHKDAAARGIAGAHQRIDENQEKLELKADKAAMEEQLHALRMQFNEAERRGDSLGAETIRLRAQLTRFEQRLEAVNPESNDLSGERRDLEEIARKLGAFDDLGDRLRAMREDVDRQGVEQEVLASGHNKLVGKHNKLTGRVHDAENDIKMIKAQEPPRRFLLLSFVIALIAGFIAGYIWSNTTFQTTIPLTEPLVYDDWRNEPQYPLIAGIGAFAATLAFCFIISLFLRGRTQSPDRATSKENDGELAEPYKAPSIEQNPEPIENSLLGDPATKPYEAVGAGNGTR